jgi:hypothetical protein
MPKYKRQFQETETGVEKVNLGKVTIKKPKSPKIVPNSIEWMKKGKDATCAY